MVDNNQQIESKPLPLYFLLSSEFLVSDYLDTVLCEN